MITAIQVNYTERGVLGEYESRNDRLEGFLCAEHIDKAIEKVVADGKRCEMSAAHFNHSDGSNDAVWQEYGQYGTRMLTWRHSSGPWSSDTPVEISTADFKRYVKKELRKETA